MLNLKRGWRQLVEHLRRLLESPTSELSHWGRLAVYQIRLWRFCGRQLVRDRLLVVAGHLTFKTLLSIIPLFVIFLLVTSFFAGGPETGKRAMDTIFDLLNIDEIRMKEGGPDLAAQINVLVTSVRERVSAAAIIGVIFLFFLATNVLGTVEGAMNRIWRTEAKRPFWRKYGMFYLILTLGPIAVALAIYVATYIDQQASAYKIPAWLDVTARWSVGLATVWFVLFLVYKLLPHLDVGSRAALTGAVVAGTLWHVVGKSAFGLYIDVVIGPRNVYGNLSVVPVFFMWIYVTWIFVLFGCELAYVIQNLKDLARAEALERRRDRFLATDFVGLLVTVLCGRRFRDGLGPTSIEMLAGATGVGRGDLEEVLARLEAAGLIARTAPGSDAQEPGGAVLPAREPGELPVVEVLRAARGRLPVPADAAHLPLHEAVRAAYDRARAGEADSAGGPTVADIMSAVKPLPPPDADR